MLVSSITVKDVAKYLRVDMDGDYSEFQPLLEAAKSFIKSYTALDDEEMDEHEDFYIVVLILCQDMYDNRTMYVEKDNLNQVVQTILGMHSENLIA